MHWADADDPRFAYSSVVSGIAEFLAPEHKQRFYSHVGGVARVAAAVRAAVPAADSRPRLTMEATEQLQDKADQPWHEVLSSLPGAAASCQPSCRIAEHGSMRRQRGCGWAVAVQRWCGQAWAVDAATMEGRGLWAADLLPVLVFAACLLACSYCLPACCACCARWPCSAPMPAAHGYPRGHRGLPHQFFHPGCGGVVSIVRR